MQPASSRRGVTNSNPSFLQTHVITPLNNLIERIKKAIHSVLLKLSNILPVSVQFAMYKIGMIQLPTTATSDKHESQLLVSSRCNAVFFHDSTVPLNEYPNGFHNSDRGGFGHGKNGTNFGVIFDGCGSSMAAMDAAQKFTTATLNKLSHLHAEIKGTPDVVKKCAVELFQTAARASEAGDATGGFAVFEPCAQNQYNVHGAAVGDVAIFHIDRNNISAHQLNAVKKDPRDYRNSGGAIVSSMPDFQDIQDPSLFTKSVLKNDIVILATDGLTDNIFIGQAEKIIPLIIFSSKFDEPIDQLCKDQPWTQTTPHTLPTEEELEKFIGGRSTLNTQVDNQTIAKRLNAYLKMITDQQCKMIFGVNEGAKAIQNDPKIQDKLKEIRRFLDDAKAQNKTASKTDDCMLVVLSPSVY